MGLGIPPPQPGHQRDYQAFIAIWRALEADYGAPPNRDFIKWKQDPCAYGPLPGDAELAAPSDELCTVDDDRVLLECWIVVAPILATILALNFIPGEKKVQTRISALYAVQDPQFRTMSHLRGPHWWPATMYRN